VQSRLLRSCSLTKHRPFLSLLWQPQLIHSYTHKAPIHTPSTPPNSIPRRAFCTPLPLPLPKHGKPPTALPLSRHICNHQRPCFSVESLIVMTRPGTIHTTLHRVLQIRSLEVRVPRIMTIAIPEKSRVISWCRALVIITILLRFVPSWHFHDFPDIGPDSTIKLMISRPRSSTNLAHPTKA
jgi:hypothetical protein